jgi:metal-sulfur cluster biosynthetic enzyme
MEVVLMPKEAQSLLPSDVPDRAIILERLHRVLDPELDEPVLQLGFIKSLHVQGGHATVAMHMPTSWCAVNFVYMMAEDIRHALLTVESIHAVTIRLGDHFAAPAIETGVNAGTPFAEAFAAEGGGNLDALREIFLRKGFTSRQERLLRGLKDAGLTAADICAMRIGDLSFAGDACLARCAGRKPVEVGPADTARRYLQRRGELGLDGSPTWPLITDLQDQPLAVERLEEHWTRARTVRLSLEANGALCRAVLAARQTNAHDMLFLGQTKCFQR